MCLIGDGPMQFKMRPTKTLGIKNCWSAVSVLSGPTGTVAESEFQRSLHRVDPHKSSAGVRGVSIKVSMWRPRYESTHLSIHPFKCEISFTYSTEVWRTRFVVHRYGLPVNFQAMLLQPNKKNMKKLREVLYDLYKHLDSSAAIIDVSLRLKRFTRALRSTVKRHKKRTQRGRIQSKYVNDAVEKQHYIVTF